MTSDTHFRVRAPLPGMARRSTPLPDPLGRGPFAVRAALSSGVSRGRLRNPSLVTPLRGVRSNALPNSAIEQARAAAAAIRLPFAFSHLTAARILELPLPDRWQPAESIHVLRPSTSPVPRIEGVTGRRGLESRRVYNVAGLTVTTPADTWADLGTMLGVDALVVVGDAVLTRGVALDELASRVEARAHHRGNAGLRLALQLMRPGSGSPMETRSRLVFHRAGLPEPRLNADVFADDGGWILRGDFVWQRQRVIAEYQGNVHRIDRKTWQDGFIRRRLAEDNGWAMVEFTARDIFAKTPQRELVATLSRLLGSRPRPGA